MTTDQPKDRLKKAVLAATGLTSPTEVWNLHRKVLGVGKDLFISNMNGNRAISKGSAEKYAKVFNVTPGWLLYGVDTEDGAAPAPRSQFAEVSALAAALNEADAKALYEQLSARISSATPAKSPRGQPRKPAAKAR